MIKLMGIDHIGGGGAYVLAVRSCKPATAAAASGTRRSGVPIHGARSEIHPTDRIGRDCARRRRPVARTDKAPARVRSVNPNRSRLATSKSDFICFLTTSETRRYDWAPRARTWQSLFSAYYASTLLFVFFFLSSSSFFLIVFYKIITSFQVGFIQRVNSLSNAYVNDKQAHLVSMPTFWRMTIFFDSQPINP